MCLLYQVKRDLLRTFLDFFWIPRVTSPALRAEEEVGNRNHESFDTYGIAFMARGEVIVSGCCFHMNRMMRKREAKKSMSSIVSFIYV